jgi:hypothetical protein
MGRKLLWGCKLLHAVHAPLMAWALGDAVKCQRVVKFQVFGGPAQRRSGCPRLAQGKSKGSPWAMGKAGVCPS